MKKTIICATSIMLCSNVSAENIIRALWNNVKSNQDDISKKHDGIARQNVGPFYFYRLKQPTRVTKPAPDPVEQLVEPIVIVKEHPDIPPVQDVIDNNLKSKEISEVAVKNEKVVVYGDDSPLRDDAVSAAWERVNTAEKRLEDHRKYMERVRKSRKNVEQAKTIAGEVNQKTE